MSGANLAGLLDGPARWCAERPAILVGDRPVRTWAELAEAVARRAGGLRERHGVRPGRRRRDLRLQLHPVYLEILFSVWQAGAVAVPISSRLHAREAATMLDRAPREALLRDADVAGELRGPARRAPRAS